MNSNDPRIIKLGSILNLRDFGGWPAGEGAIVRRGMLYRSADLHRASRRDLELLRSLGIRLVVDLRTSGERATHPDRALPGWEPRVVHLPVLEDQKFDMGHQIRKLLRTKPMPDPATIIHELYRLMVREYAGTYGALIRALAAPDSLPVLVHCQGGKDRTGVACALILTALGVAREDVMQDYLVSNELIGRAMRTYMRRLWVMSFFRIAPRTLQPIFEVRREYLETAFGEMESRCGSAAAYVGADCGIGEREAAALRKALVSAGSESGRSRSADADLGVVDNDQCAPPLCGWRALQEPGESPLGFLNGRRPDAQSYHAAV